MPWERIELRGPFRRFWKTIRRAINPIRFYSLAAQRRNVPVFKAGKFIAVCVVASLSLHAVGLAADSILFFCRLLWSGGQADVAARTVLRFLSVTWVTDLIGPSAHVLSSLLGVLVIAWFVRLRLSNAFRVTDFAAFLGPAMVLQASLLVVSGELLPLLPDVALGPLYPSHLLLVSIDLGLPVIMAYFLGRHTLELSRRSAVTLAALGFLIQYGCSEIVWKVLQESIS